MREQPTGSITLVFTDVEGSTRLLHELGEEAYRDALAEHRRVVREAFAAGYEVDEEGDAFFYAFPTAASAVAAVEHAMRALVRWPIRIRVGVHTGEPILDPPKDVGLDVHRAARVMAAGHGGQVLLSESARALLDDGVLVRDLGEHRLKDLQGRSGCTSSARTRFLRSRRCTRRTCRSHRRHSSAASARSRTCSSCSDVRMSRSSRSPAQAAAARHVW